MPNGWGAGKGERLKEQWEILFMKTIVCEMRQLSFLPCLAQSRQTSTILTPLSSLMMSYIIFALLLVTNSIFPIPVPNPLHDSLQARHGKPSRLAPTSTPLTLCPRRRQIQVWRTSRGGYSAQVIRHHTMCACSFRPVISQI